MWQSGKVANVSHFGEAMVADLGGGREIRNLLWGDCGRGEINKFFCSDCYWAVAHATRSSEGSQSCRED